MSDFFKNVQVWMNKCPPGKARKLIILCIREWLLAGKYVEVRKGEEADRTIIIGPVGKGPWISVFDEVAEYSDICSLDKIALRISASFRTAAVGIVVNDDDDMMMLRLFKDGILKDYCKRDISGFKKLESSGNTKKWKDFLISSASESNLRDAWDAKRISSYDFIGKIADLLGWDANWCLTGFRYLLEPHNSLKGCYRLCFRLKKRPAFEKKLKKKVTGLPVLEIGSWCYSKKFNAGETCEWFDFGFRNIKGASKGVKVFLWGSVIEQGLVQFESVRLRWGPVENTHQCEAPLQSYLSQERKLVFTAHFPKFEIPALPFEASYLSMLLRNALYLRYIKAMENWFAFELKLKINARALKKGKGKLYIALSPDANPKRGRVVNSTFLRFVKGPNGKP